jgi:dienelactone hydrolase
MRTKFYPACFVVVLLLSSVKIFAQSGTYHNSILTERPNTPIDSMINGFIEILPAEYASNPGKNYPLLIFFEGISQLGNGGTELSNLYGQNEGMLPDIVRKGLLPGDVTGDNSFTVSGATHHFIMLIPQVRPQIKSTTTDWVATPGQVNDVINYALQNYRVDADSIYLGGLSLGGGAVINYAGASTSFGNRVAAIISFSPATNLWDDHSRVTNIAQANVPLWFFVVAGDHPYDTLAQRYIDSLDTHPSYTAEHLITQYPSGGHDSWVDALEAPANSGNSTYPNVYKWLLTKSRSVSQPQFATVSAGSDQVLNLANGSMLLSIGGISFSGATVTLNGSATAAGGTSITGIQWVKVDGTGGTITSPNSLNTTVTDLKPGSYTYQLRVTDNQGLTTVSNVKVTVNAPLENKYVKVESEAFTGNNSSNSPSTVENSYYDQGPATGLGFISPGYWVDYTINSLSAGSYALYYRYTSQYNTPTIQIISGTSTATHIIPTTGTVPPLGPWSSDSIHIDLGANPTIRFFFPSSNPSMEVHLNYFELAQLSVGSGLPVKFEYVSSECKGGGVMNVQWRTSAEQNTDRFSVQRSVDGVSWSEIGSVAAAGQSSVQRSYVFADRTAGATNLYRVVEYDYNGQATISNIVRGGCGIQGEIRLYPNPSKGSSALSIPLSQASSVRLQVMDSKGAVVQQKQIMLPAGNNTVPIDVSSYAEGVYSVQVQYNNQTKTIKLIKQ